MKALRDLSQDFLFPGLEHVPPNTVTLLETNSKFVESFLVGLNAEMSHELLWRDYPTDQRGTYFRQFWDTPQQDATSTGSTPWGNAELGKNAHAGESLVLLLRGELLRRYPNSVIYAVKAEKINGQLDLSRDATDERHPLFRGTLKPDVTFLGLRSHPRRGHQRSRLVLRHSRTAHRADALGWMSPNFAKPPAGVKDDVEHPELAAFGRH